MLKIEDLHVSIDRKKILNGINLNIKKGEIHVIMGPNGSGKSTLSSVIAGKDDYVINKGDIFFNKESILNFTPEKRSQKGLFLSFQYPVEIPGLSIINFLRTSVNSIRKSKNLNKISASDFLKKIEKVSKIFNIKKDFLYRPLNYGFSGGEKKLSEILQMAVIEPKLSILDEIDSGLDIDILRTVSKGINILKNKNNSMLIITHYQRFLEYITPNYIHILYNGKIIKSGNQDISFEIEKQGYDYIKNI